MSKRSVLKKAIYKAKKFGTDKEVKELETKLFGLTIEEETFMEIIKTNNYDVKIILPECRDYSLDIVEQYKLHEFTRENWVFKDGVEYNNFRILKSCELFLGHIVSQCSEHPNVSCVIVTPKWSVKVISIPKEV